MTRIRILILAGLAALTPLLMAAETAAPALVGKATDSPLAEGSKITCTYSPPLANGQTITWAKDGMKEAGSVTASYIYAYQKDGHPHVISASVKSAGVNGVPVSVVLSKDGKIYNSDAQGKLTAEPASGISAETLITLTYVPLGMKAVTIQWAVNGQDKSTNNANTEDWTYAYQCSALPKADAQPISITAKVKGDMPGSATAERVATVNLTSSGTIVPLAGNQAPPSGGGSPIGATSMTLKGGTWATIMREYVSDTQPADKNLTPAMRDIDLDANLLFTPKLTMASTSNGVANMIFVVDGAMTSPGGAATALHFPDGDHSTVGYHPSGLGKELNPAFTTASAPREGTANDFDVPPFVINLDENAHQPGDKLTVRIRAYAVAAGDGQMATNAEPISTATYNFRMRHIGPYFSFGVMPIVYRNDHRFDDGHTWNFGLVGAYNLHYGMRDEAFWNDSFDPALGVHVAILNSTAADSSVLKYGFGVNLSLFKGIIAGGVGYQMSSSPSHAYYFIGMDLLQLYQTSSTKPTP